LAMFELVFSEEMPTLETFFVSPKAAYSISTLLNHAELVFSKTEIPRLPKQAVEDIRCAGRCIAFELPTAAGFHAFRALESVVIDYLEKLKSRPKGRNLGVCIEALEQNGADTKATAILRQLKDLYRNPLAHPTDNLTTGEDIGVFQLAHTAMSALLRDREKRGL
jgi:hypothetical protein